MGKRKRAASRKSVAARKKKAKYLKDEDESVDQNQLPKNIGTNNPLLNHLILKKVFEYIIGSCSPSVDLYQPMSDNAPTRYPYSPAVAKDVVSIRSVCKLWRHCITRPFRDVASPTRIGTLNAGGDQRSQGDAKAERLVEIMKLIPPDLFPVEKFVLCGSIFSGPKNRKLFSDFMNLCAPHAVEMYFQVENSDDWFFPRTEFKDFRMEKLKIMEITCEENNCRSSHKSTRNYNFLTFTKEVLLAKSPNLTALKITTYWNNIQDMRAIDTIKYVFKDIPKTVKKFSIGGVHFSDSQLSTLTDCKLKLEECDINLQNKLCCDQALYRFLEGQCDTLKELVFYGHSARIFHLPHLKELVHLESHHALLQPFSTNMFPKLAVLNLGELALQSENDCRRMLFGENVAPTVVELSMYLRVCSYSVGYIQSMSECFPNIRKLRIEFGTWGNFAQVVQDVFVYFPDIQDLAVHFRIGSSHHDTNMDSLLSGVAHHDRVEIMKERKNFDAVDLSGFQCRPSILNLKKLQRLLIAKPWNGGFFTGFSAHFIFSKMPCLEEVYARHFQMPVDCIDMLKKKLKIAEFEDERITDMKGKKERTVVYPNEMPFYNF